MQHPYDERRERSRKEAVRSTGLLLKFSDYCLSSARRMHPRRWRLTFGHVVAFLSVPCFVYLVQLREISGFQGQ